MKSHLLNIGFGNVVVTDRIVAIVSPGSAPIKRLKEDAREQGRLIDATYGRKTRAIIVTDSNHVVLSAINPETAAMRLLNKKTHDLADIQETGAEADSEADAETEADDFDNEEIDSTEVE